MNGIDKLIFSIFSRSYEAAEDNEITFREGEFITEIEPASEDWWQGKNPAGDLGLFPGGFQWHSYGKVYSDLLQPIMSRFKSNQIYTIEISDFLLKARLDLVSSVS